MRLIFVGLALGASLSGCARSASGLDPSRFESLHRAGRATKETVNVGVNSIKLRELVAAYATEVSLASERAQTSDEKTFVSFHEAARQAYSDSLVVWSEKIEQGATLHTPSFSANSDALARIVDAYALDGTKDGTMFTFAADDGLQKIWSTAAAKLDSADAMFLRKEP